MKTSSALTSLFVVVGVAAAATADVITSNFDADPDGWRVSDGITPDAELASGDPIYSPTDGNGGGFIAAPIDWATRSFFVAPNEFLGDQSDKTAVSLDRRFVEPRVSIDPYQIDYDADVVATSDSLSIAVDLDPVSLTAWESFSVELSPAGGWFVLGTGDAATADQIASVFGDLTDIRVRGNLNDVSSNIGFDNFSLVPSAGSLSLLALAGLSAGRRRR